MIFYCKDITCWLLVCSATCPTLHTQQWRRWASGKYKVNTYQQRLSKIAYKKLRLTTSSHHIAKPNVACCRFSLHIYLLCKIYVHFGCNLLIRGRSLQNFCQPNSGLNCENKALSVYQQSQSLHIQN